MPSRIAFLVLLALCFSCTRIADPITSGEPSGEIGASTLDVVPYKITIAPEDTVSEQPPVLPLTVEQEQALLMLPPGYRLTPVLTDPVIKEPAAIAFDGNGRMFVLELRTYMQDIDATGELTPAGRISMHEDSDNDGVYDTHHVFVDSLIFPRFVMPFGPNSILTMESNEDEVYRFTDTDGDGRADHKELFTSNYGKAGNVEHQQAFLYTGMDNWMYSTYNTFRIRWTPEGILREPTGYNHSQWGVTQDDDGKIWFQGGASGHPGYFQFPVVYGNYEVPEPFAEGFNIPYSISGLGDYQPGANHSRPDGTLNNVTGSAGNDIFRGHRLPEDLKGHLIYGEPVGRIVRRVEPVVTDGLTQLHNVYQEEQSEFIRSLDPLFRPVDMATAPDGSLYIVDMYRGIIQQGNWVQEGTFLRAKVKQYQLDKVVGHGRIWRLTYDGIERDTRMPRMHEETPAQLVNHLLHPNGWWRDTAQQLLVLAQDKSVVPSLEDIVRTSGNQLGRIHALWTLEGLQALDVALIQTLFQDEDPRMRTHALRASESLYKAGETSLSSNYQALAADVTSEVAIQAMMTMDVLGVAETKATVEKAKASSTSEGVQFVADQILRLMDEVPFDRYRWSETQIAALTEGESIFGNLCSQCHGRMGQGTPIGNGQVMAPALTSSDRVQGHPDYVVKVLLHGLQGPIEDKAYPGGMMVGMGENTDEWVAAVSSYIRTQLSNDGTFVTPQQVAAIRRATEGREQAYSYAELSREVPVALKPNAQTWTVSASHSANHRVGGSDDAFGALTFEGWTTGLPQEPGMWFQVEFPEPVTLTEIQFESPPIRRGWGDNAPPPLQTYPRSYTVHTSDDGINWSEAIVSGEGQSSRTVLSFLPTETSFIRINQTALAPEEDLVPWNMRSMKFFALCEGSCAS